MSRTNRFRWLGIPLVALAMIAIPLTAGAVLTAPATYEGNQTCGDFNSAWVELYKAEIGARQGSAAGVSWTVFEGENGELVEWTSSQPLVAVAVKGGNVGGNLYMYDPATSADRGLHTPMNPSEKWADVSHISFCVHPNEPESGVLVIEKVTEPSDGYAVFEFAISGGDMQGLLMMPLRDGESASFEIVEGWYTIAESPADGWTFEAVSCDSAYDPMGSGVAVFVGEGQTVTCTFLNGRDYEPLPGTVTIKKVTAPATEAVPFTFATDIPVDDGVFGPTLFHGGVASVEAWPGVYTVDEIVPDGWLLTGVACTDDDVRYTETGAVIEVDYDENVECTFTNEPIEEEEGRVVIRKLTEPATPDIPFSFTSDIPRGDGLFEPVLHHGQTDGTQVEPGMYTIDELIPEGWDLTGVECDDDEYVVTDTGAQIYVEAGERVRCIFTNEPIEEEEGRVVIRKLTEPATPDIPFSFTSDIPRGDGLFEPVLHHGQTDGTQVEPGMYTIDELIPDGWNLTGVECDDDEYVVTDTGAQISVEAGERVRCIFTNEPEPEPEPGMVVISKVTDPVGSEELFDFDSSIPDGEGFWTPSVMGGDSDSIEVDAGTYTVDELIPEGWDLTDVTCDAEESSISSTGATFSVGEGETVSCTFTNEAEPEPGMVVITKITDPEDDEAWFQFTSSILDDGEDWEPVLMHEESASIEVDAGTYTVSEVEKAGWELADVTCDDDASIIVEGMVTLDVAEGETVSCTFTNEPTEEPVPAGIVLEKITDPVDTDSTFEFETTVPEDSGFWAPVLGHEDSETIEVEPGVYTIDEVMPDGWQLQGIECDDPESEFGDDGVILDIDESETVTCTFTNELIPPELGAIGDFVWNDANGNGLQDTSEVGVEGVVVKLFEVAAADANATTTSDGTLVDLLMTDEDGLYLFEDVPAGYYFVEFSNLPTDFEFTEPFMGDDHELDSDALIETGLTPIMELAEGERDLECDAGIFLEKVSPKQETTTTTTNTEVGAKTTSTTEPVILPFTGVDSAETGMAAIALVIMGSLLVMAAGLVRRFNN